jgi:hypothetical protein
MVKMCMPCGGFKKLSINDDIVPDSAFVFACRLNVFGIIVAAFTWALEFGVLVYFYQISQENHPKSVYVGLVPSCDSDDRRRIGGDLGGDFESDVMRRVEEGSAAICSDNFDISTAAVVCALMILILTIAPDFIGGFHLVARRRSVMQMITGGAMMVLSITAVVAAYAFVDATAINDMDVYSNCIAILFVLACDEQMFYVIKMLFPAFVEETIQEITEGDDSTAIGILNDVRFAELMGRNGKKITVETEMTSEPQQVESPHAGAPRV